MLCNAGTASSKQSITVGSFSLVSQGIYTYNYTATALEQLNFTLYIGSSAATCYKSSYCKKTTVVLNISTELPSAIDPVATANGAQIQAAGDTLRSMWNATTAPLVVSAGVWHLLYLPVIRVGGGVFYRDPGLYVQLTLGASSITAINSTSTSLKFSGYWSTSNGSYVVAFRLPASGVWVGLVDLKHSNYSTTNIVSIVPCSVVTPALCLSTREAT